MKQIIDGFLLAVQFITTIPFRGNIPWNSERAKWSVRAFPLIGLIAGILIIFQIYVLREYTPFSDLMISLWILFFGVLFTGGLHLDGWMDMSDAVFSYRDKEKKLEIMNDSRVGAFGVLSLLFLLSFRFLFIYEILQYTTVLGLILITFIPFLSRTAAAVLLVNGKPAKSTGMAAAYEGMLSKKDVFFIVAVVIATSGVFVLFIKSLLCPITILLVGCLLLYLFAKAFFSQQFGGITGDTLGALLEGEETFLWFILWLLYSFSII
ncbi:MAG TPA: adenosylcobinamide-GDP ribazoletransferase [Bacillus bacterium]|nr:adenosylcobinamide-GDP ribazoletransferase [Bacillus sp. (in: firmicutes)]